MGASSHVGTVQDTQARGRVTYLFLITTCSNRSCLLMVT